MHAVAPRMDDGLKVFFFYGLTFSIIAALAYAAVLYGNYEKAQEWKRFVKEANRDKELREVCYSNYNLILLVPRTVIY